MSTIVCPQCGAVNELSANFCGGCGGRMAPQAPQYQVPPMAPQYQQSAASMPDPGFPAQATIGGSVTAGFGVRLGAFVIDAVILYIPNYLVGSMLTYLIQIVYYIFMWGSRGQTVGEMILGLRVVSADGQPMTFSKAAIRLLGYVVSALTLGIGFLMIAFDDQEHRGLHDRIAGTLMVRKA